MKNKPLRHKETNTFKFQPFSERIAEIKIDVFHRVKHKYEEDDEETTYFHQTLEKWILLNCSESFEELRNEIGYSVHILPQLLAQKDRLVDVLKKHLSNKNTLNLQALLELIIAFAKDLRQEFYPYFKPVYNLLIETLDTKNSEQLEWVFQCLAYLFKFLWRYIVNNLSDVFESLLPLLSSSKPFYINNFAAQSFAFVARKLKDPGKLIKLTLRSLKKHPQGLDGCGRLIFEIIHGIPGQFHSCAEETLKCCFTSLEDSFLLHSPLCQLLTSTVSHILLNIHAKHVTILWNILLEKLIYFHGQWKATNDIKSKENVKFALSLVQQMIEFKHCSYITEIETLTNRLLFLLEAPNQIDCETTIQISNALVYILLSPDLKLTQEMSSKIVILAMSNLKEDETIWFLSRTFNFSGFEGLVLSRLIELCSVKDPFRMLPLLTKLIIKKSQPPKNVHDLFLWKPYTLDFTRTKRNDQNKYCDIFLNFLSSKVPSGSIEELDLTVSILLVLPHILPIQRNEAVSIVNKLFLSVLKNLEDKSNDLNTTTSLLALQSLALETLIKLQPDESISKLCSPEIVLDVLLPFANEGNLIVLKTLDFYISADENNSISPFVSKIKSTVINSLLSPYHKVRELSTHILYEIEKSAGHSNNVMRNLLEICWKVETIPATLTEYRDKLKELQKLSCTNETIKDGLLNNELDPDIFLKFFLGLLYINFQLIWEPVSKLIISYAEVLKPNQFWNVFGEEVDEVAKIIRGNKNESILVPPFTSDYLKEMFLHLNTLEEKPDHIHHRILLWNILQDCIPVCGAHHKDIATQFLLFMEEEYLKRNSEAAFTWDVRKKENEGTSVIVNEVSKVEDSLFIAEEEMEVDEMENEMEIDNINSERKEENEDKDNEAKNDSIELETADEDKFRWITKTLLAHMRVLSKMKTPKKMHREPELANIYFDFLSHKLPDVQRAALDCILTYKHSFLTPYKDHLFGLIDDKTFKTEITLFRIDTQSNVVKLEHRTQLIPIVLRIVYSKMYQSGAKGVTKHARKATVIRFLAGCSSEEINCFFKMAFNLLKDYIEREEDIVAMTENIIKNTNLEKAIPPKRLQSAVYLIKTLTIYCGGLLGPNHLSYLLRILLALTSHITGVLKQRENAHPGHIKNLRNIRNVCYEILNKFYTNFDSYPWTTEEIDSVFMVFIWPYLPSLRTDGVNNPTPLFRLFLTWARNSRYFVLLGKINESDGLSPLTAIMDLWPSEKTHFSVCNFIMELVESLLTLQDFNKFDYDDTKMVEELKITNCAQLNEDKIKSLKENLNYGSKLLLPYIPTILERMHRKLQSKQALLKRDMEVMSRITEMVSDSETSDKLLTLLLPIILKKSGAGGEVVIPLLNTVLNLINNVHNPGKFVLKLAPLFGTISDPPARKLLFSIAFFLSEQKGSESGLDISLLEDLNAWDVKWLDQPDFTRRLAAFKKLELMADQKNISLNLGVIVIYTCFHFIRNEKDTALRDNAKHCLKKVCPVLCHSISDCIKDRNFVLNDTILTQIRSGLSEKQSDNIRDDSILLLGHMARECADFHPVLKDLSFLGNKIDLEVDFFENICHLQLHRRVRAMLKFANIFQTLDKSPNPRTITQFILPIISHYFLNKKYANKNTIMDSAILALGTACKFLPWHQYQSVLLYYLGKLQEEIHFQKQLVKIIVEILNAFHFDLSQANLKEIESEFCKAVGKSNKPNEDSNNKSDEQTKNDIEDSIDEVVKADKVAEHTKEIEDYFEDSFQVDSLDDKESLPTKTANKQALLSRSAANRVIKTITITLLPQLQNILTQKMHSETFHKLATKSGDVNLDDEIILRIPLAVAVVKILQKLPFKELLNRNLTGILMKLFTLLKSRLESVRRVTRETLQTIMMSLGPEYLSSIIRDMSSILTKGFHIHVLSFTVHSVLIALKKNFKKGDLDNSIHSIINICKLDLFSSTSDEKEVNQIAGKVLEARSTKSYDIFQIISAHTTECYLLDIILPLKEELSRTLSHKNVTKVENCLQQIVLGFTENEFLDPISLLQFAYGMITESIPVLIVGLKDIPVDKKQLEFVSRKNPDIYIIPKEPKQKKSAESKICIRTNAHVLVEFGLKLLFFLLKRGKILKSEHIPHIDPFIDLLLNCIKSQHVKVSTLTLKCLTWCLRMELPSIEKNISFITEQLFDILHKYATALRTKGDNFDLAMATFKAIAVIVRDVKYHHLEDTHTHTLLLYCEQYLEDFNQQATAFSLLHAVLLKKIQTPELNDVMKKVASLSITSNADSVRHQARGIVLFYIKEYRDKLGNDNLLYFLAFYSSQLSYDIESGRNSALEMFTSFIDSLPKETIKEQSGVIFINISTRLVNDSSPGCREKAANVIELLLNNLDNNSKDKLFDVIKLWFTDTNLAHRRLAAQLVGIFVKYEKGSFQKRLDDFFPLVVDQFIQGFQENKPGRFVLLKQEEENGLKNDDRMRDHLLFQVLLMLVKICTNCSNFLKDSKYTDHLETIADYTCSLLGYPHEWVRELAVQFLNLVIRTIPVSQIIDLVNHESVECEGFLLSNTRLKLKSLILDLIAQLVPEENSSEKFLLQCIKLLIYLAQIVKDVKPETSSDTKNSLSLVWMVKRVRKSVNLEITQFPSSIIVRTMAFNWSAALAVKLSREELNPIASYILSPMLREINLDDHLTLKKIAKEATACIRNKLGSEVYNNLVANLTTRLEIKKAEKRKERSQLMVTNPERAAKRKINKQLKKKEAKKRKLTNIKTQKFKFKRKLKEDIDLEEH